MQNRQTSGAARFLIYIGYLIFIGLGLSSGLLGLAWPSLRRQLGLELDAVNGIYIAQTVSYSLVGFLIGRLMSRFGSGTTLLVGMVLFGISLFGVALSPNWPLILVFSFITGLGSGVIDAGLNLYASAHHSPRQMSWLHAFFGIGITLGPVVMTEVLKRNLPWQIGYKIVGAALLLIAVAVALTRRQWLRVGFQATTGDGQAKRAPFAVTLRAPVVWLSMALFVIYVGTEIGIGQWAYTVLTEARGLPVSVSGRWVSIYWGAFTGGRFFFGLVSERFSVKWILRACLLSTVLGAFLFWWHPTISVGMVGLIIAGFAQAPVFPMLMSDTSERVGPEHAENTISLQMCAVGVGAALLPGQIGTIGKYFGLERMPLTCLIMSVLVVVCFELTGRRPRADRPTG